MKESEVRELIREAIFDVMTEGLCPKGKAYIAKRKRAGEKSSAYLSGRAVKVCKGQMKSEGEESGQVNIFGYQTQHFDICPSAYALYKKIVDENLVDDKDLVIRVAKLLDNLFYMEKLAKENPNIVTDSFVDVAQNTADLIMSAAGIFCKPGIVIIDPHITTINSAPEDNLTSLIGIS